MIPLSMMLDRSMTLSALATSGNYDTVTLRWVSIAGIVPMAALGAGCVHLRVRYLGSHADAVAKNIPTISDFSLNFETVNRVEEYMGEWATPDFLSPIDVVAAAKVLMWRRQRKSVMQVQQLLYNSMRQHGRSDAVALFSMCLVYSVHEVSGGSSRWRLTVTGC